MSEEVSQQPAYHADLRMEAREKEGGGLEEQGGPLTACKGGASVPQLRREGSSSPTHPRFDLVRLKAESPAQPAPCFLRSLFPESVRDPWSLISGRVPVLPLPPRCGRRQRILSC